MIIAIGGVSQAGKTTLANRLKAKFETEGKTVDIFQLDDFVKSKDELPTINDTIDWEHPDGIDYKSFNETLQLASGRYDIIIAEGHLIYCNDDLNKIFDKCIFLEIDRNTFLERRRKETRWGEEPEWYYDHVWTSYTQFGKCPEIEVKTIQSFSQIPEKELSV